MEKNFYTDNFEQLLKESTENFRMYPSKKVWHSIYNDLHPSRRWPSFAIWILLIFSISYIGSTHQSPAALKSGKGKGVIADNNTAVRNSIRNIQPVSTSPATASLYTNSNTIKSTPAATIPGELNGYAKNTRSRNLNKARIQVNSGIAGNDENSNTNNTKTGNKNIITTIDDELNTTETKAATPNDESQALNQEVTVTTEPVKDKDEVKKDERNKLKSAKEEKDREWMEDFAFHNKPATSKWKNRISHQLYMTPSIGYRVLSNNSRYQPVSSSLLATTTNNNQDYKTALTQAPAVNIEVGGNFLYNLAKRWNLKAGIQFNYTNYAILAYELKHPTSTTLMLNNLNNNQPVLVPRSTTLVNSSGVSSKKLNNNTYQVSLPIGADIRLAGKNNFKWYAGATIQPTYVVSGHSYLVSSDLKYYVTDNSFIRNWNLNAAVETFISYKTKAGIIVNAGPQLRYQLLSTYSKEYTYSERLYNLGLKIGITTRF